MRWGRRGFDRSADARGDELAATGITNVGATLNGTVNPNGLATQAWFEWGTSPTLVAPDNTAKQNFAAGTTVQAVSAVASDPYVRHDVLFPPGGIEFVG